MLSSYRWSAPLLAAVLIVSGCAVDRQRDTQTGTHPPQQTPPPRSEPVKPPPPPAPVAAPRPATPTGPLPIPSAPTTGGAGYYQDSQQSLLTERLGGAGIRVQRNGDALRVIVPARLAFSLSSDQIQPAFAPTLDTLAQILKEYGKTSIEVRGYTDSTGSFEHNQQLSERRAQSIGAYLASRQIAPARIRTAGFGPRNPIAGNDSEAGRVQNRRIEIELVPTP